MHIGYNTRRIHCATRLSVNTDTEGGCRASTEQMQTRYSYEEGRGEERNGEGKHARADTALGCLQRIAIPRSLFPFVVAPSNVSRIRAAVEKRGRSEWRKWTRRWKRNYHWPLFSGVSNKMNVTSARPPFVGLFDFEILVWFKQARVERGMMRAYCHYS